MTGAPESTSSSLLKRVKANDAEAWHRLLDLYSPLVYSWCRRSGMKADAAADVLQEVFQAVFSNIAGFRHDRPGDTFRGWLRIITSNKIRDHFWQRRHEAEARGGTDAYQRFLELAQKDHDATGSRPLDDVFRRALDVIRAEFEDRTWRAFWQATVQERPTSEIAEELDISQAAVRQAKSRVLRRLRRELADME